MTTSPTTSAATTGARPRKTAAASSAPAAPAAAPSAGKAGTPAEKIDLPRAVSILADGDVLTPEGLYQFLESLRVISTAAAFYTESAGTQLVRAASRGARASKDGRMTLEQKLRMKLVLRRVAKAMGAAHDDLFKVAKDAMDAYTPMESFLEELESEHTSRPHRDRASRAGFDPFGGR